MTKLKQWREKGGRKPLILQGARQSGKTYLLKQFGRENFTNTVYLNFEQMGSDLEELFTGTISPSRLINFLAIKTNSKIMPEKTLIIFDEVQELPRALTALKYFYEEAPEYAMVAAGSFLGVALHQGTSFPVGKADFLELQPLDFEEFLWAMGVGAEKLQQAGENNLFDEELKDYLRQYLVIGGMPEAVTKWAKNRDIEEVNSVLNAILTAYRHDFSKHAQANMVERINQIWQSIPAQLFRENKKFIYGVVKEGARAREYELALQWLIDAGLVRRVDLLKTGDKLPLKAYVDTKSYKLYFLDVGLLRVHSGAQSEVIINNETIFKEYGGSFAEQFVLSELKAGKNEVYYWSGGAMSEVDFVIGWGKNIIPIEVKSGTNTKAKSLKVYREKYRPKLSVRFSLLHQNYKDGLVNIPLYKSWRWQEVARAIVGAGEI